MAASVAFINPIRHRRPRDRSRGSATLTRPRVGRNLQDDRRRSELDFDQTPACLGKTPRVIAIDPISLPSTIYENFRRLRGYARLAASSRAPTRGKPGHGIYTKTPVRRKRGGAVRRGDRHRSASPSRLYLARHFLRYLVHGEWTVARAGPPRTAMASTSGRWPSTPRRPRRFMPGTYSGAVFRTTDRGDHWMSLTDGPLGAASVNVVATSASAPANGLRRRPHRHLPVVETEGRPERT